MIHPKAEAYLNFILQLVIALVAVITLGVMIIWVVDPTLFVRLLPNSATMKFNTALLFDLVALHLWLTHRRQNNSHFNLNIVAILTILISSLTMIAYWTASPLFLDELIVSDPLTPIDQYPGRMSAATAFMFLLFGIAQLLYNQRAKLAEAVLICINLMGLIALFAFLFDVSALYDLFFFSTVSYHTAFLFILLSMVAILTLPHGFIHELIKVDEPGGKALRWMLPITLLVPFTAGWLILQGMNLGIYQPAFALDIFIVTIVTMQLILTVMYAYSAQKWFRKDRENQKQLLNHQIELIELEHIREIKELKEDLFAKISHDMRQPITNIVMSTDILMKFERRLKSGDRRNHIKRIHDQALAMLDFADDIMILSQSELDEIPFNPMTDDIIEFCQSYVQNFFELRDVSLHKLVMKITPHEMLVSYDKKLVRRLLGNLLSNAIKYSPEGGDIAVNIVSTNHNVTVSVTDEGVGIPEEDMAGLFDLFQRASNVNEFMGHGIGLAIVQQIAQLHHAEIDVQSTVDVGTTFSVTFPTV